MIVLRTSSVPSTAGIRPPRSEEFDGCVGGALITTTRQFAAVSAVSSDRKNLRSLREAYSFANSASCDTGLDRQQSWIDSMKEVDACQKSGRLPQIRVLYDNVSLWSKLTGRQLRLLGIKDRSYRPWLSNGFGDTIVIFSDDTPIHRIERLPIGVQMKLLNSTCWFKRLKRTVQLRIRDMVHASRLLTLKEVMNSADAILASLFVTFPSVEWTYARSDRILVSVISNCIMDPNWLPSWKKFKKGLRKILLSSPTNDLPEIPRQFSWLKPILTEHRIKVDSRCRLGASGIINFCQTRNTGIADGSGVQGSMNKFRKTITTPCEPIPGLMPSELVRGYLRSLLGPETLERCADSIHISISTTACVENGCSKGGKAGFAAERLRGYRRLGFGPKYIDLETGEVSDTAVPVEKTGEVLFYDALHEYIGNNEDIMKVYLSVIREAGPKWRTITSSSFFHATILHPWSKYFLELLSNVPECKSGISKSRHGWNFAQDIDPSNPRTSWFFDGKEQYCGLSTDLEEATDYFHKQVVEDIVVFLNEEFGMPKWYGQVVCNLLLRSRTVLTRHGRVCEVFIAETLRGALMGDPGTKVILTILGLAVTCSVRRVFGPKYYAVNIGDDYGGIGTGVMHEFALEEFQRLGMKISDLDTFISDQFVFFTEELIRLPVFIDDTISSVRHSRLWGRSPYIDSVKGRFLIDAKKNRDDYSYTPEGRISGLGKDISYLNEGSDPVAVFHLASLLQDVYLDTPSFEGIVYFPQQLLGQGKPILFGKKENVFSFWYAQGRSKYLPNIVRVIIDALKYASTTGLNVERSDTIMYANIGMFRHSNNVPWRVNFKRVDDPKFTPYLLAQVPRYHNYTEQIFRRLSGMIISESEISGRLMKYEYLESLIEGTTPPEAEKRLADIVPFRFGYDDLDRMTILIDQFITLWLDCPDVFDSVRSERYYHRKPVETLIGELHPFKVDMKLNPPFEGYQPRGFRIPPDMRLADDFDFSTEDPPWVPESAPFDDGSPDDLYTRQTRVLYRWLCSAWVREALGQPITDIPRDILDDDPILLQEMAEEGWFSTKFHNVFLVSDDKRLSETVAARRASIDPKRLWTFRIPIRHWVYTLMDYRYWGPEMKWDNYKVDFGSLDAWCVKYFDRVGRFELDPIDNFRVINPQPNFTSDRTFLTRDQNPRLVRFRMSFPEKEEDIEETTRISNLFGNPSRPGFTNPPFLATLGIIPPGWQVKFRVRPPKMGVNQVIQELDWKYLVEGL